ncbi:MAG TPA: hypothetical protein VJJ02_04350 [Candidatus Paceibacterota bacterium]
MVGSVSIIFREDIVMVSSSRGFFSLPKDAQEEIVAEYFRRTPLAETAVAIKALREAEYVYRLTHKGLAPKEVFELLLGPVTVSVQIVHEVREDGKRLGFALRLREENEAGYSGLYHNTCCSFRWLDDLNLATKRDDDDAFVGIHPASLERLGVTLHHEIPRMNMDMTFMYRRVIVMSDITKMRGAWRFFSDDDIRYHHKNIVESNWYQLEWVMNPFRPWFGVLRGSFPSQLLSE